MTRLADMTGLRFGRLVVLKLVGRRQSDGAAVWETRCSCGKIHFVAGKELRKGRSRSCGCYKRDCLAKKRGLVRQRLYGARLPWPTDFESE